MEYHIVKRKNKSAVSKQRDGLISQNVEPYKQDEKECIVCGSVEIAFKNSQN